ncbi:IS21 family transposase [Adlercreutzia shanghongiae]|uniref:IS21 family transposase n=1 Tax=Adlercreutzia shanghongiae TaxID=3111773 RepID=A0ABU6J1W5_9ACTN|nr:IS21 family transposase [Adlercreutzia sp. R22]MEC4296003.1 IS21 family transposase [Adlercreutzia sp. R22]
MSQVQTIRQLYRQGEKVSEIARRAGVARNTVYKYIGERDLSPKMPEPSRRGRILDDYRALIESWLDEDRRSWKKQRHTAHRIYVRLTTEEGVDVGESTVREYVRLLREERRCAAEEYLDLDWPPGTAQVDFGEADFNVGGIKRRLSFFVVSFPYSNVGVAQVFGGETAECVCQGLADIFRYVGGVPGLLVFDNATGVGKRVCDRIRTTELFSACAAHYGFDFRFCNPASGNEKGNVEAKVRYLRANLFVPVPQIASVAAYNRRLPDECMALSEKGHYLKGEPERQLFVEDRVELSSLPAKPFSCVTWVRRRADKYGKVKVGGCHLYSTDPALAGQELNVGLGAHAVSIHTADGLFVAEHARSFGSAPTDTTDPASQLAVLAYKTGGWGHSRVRSALPADIRGHMDGLARDDLKAMLRAMRDEAERSGWERTVEAMAACLAASGRMDPAGLEIAASRIGGGSITYDEPVDLAAYDAAVGMGVA